MSRGVVASLGVLVTVIFVVLFTPASTAGQGTEQNLAPLRTAWGDPDLQGVWNNATTTPLQRPPELAGKDTLTDEEVAQRDIQFAETRSLDRRDDEAPGLGTAAGGRLTEADVSRAYNEFWVERGKTIANNRTIVGSLMGLLELYETRSPGIVPPSPDVWIALIISPRHPSRHEHGYSCP